MFLTKIKITQNNEIMSPRLSVMRYQKLVVIILMVTLVEITAVKMKRKKLIPSSY